MKPLAEALAEIARRVEASPSDAPLPPEWECERCRDGRFVKVPASRPSPSAPVESTLDERRARYSDAALEGARLVPCPDCVPPESVEERQARFARLSRLGEYPALRRFTFATYSTAWTGNDRERAGMEQVVADLRAWAHEPDGPLLLAGPNGCGKTHLAAAVAHERIQFGQPALFVVAPDLLEEMRREYDDEGGREPLLDQARAAPFLVLDDIGAARLTEWAAERLFLLCNARLLADLPTLYTADLDVDEWAQPRLRRLRERVACGRRLVPGPSYTQRRYR